MSIGPLFNPPPFPQDGDVAYAAKFSDWAQYLNDTLNAAIGVGSLSITSNLDVQGNQVVNVGALRYSEVGDPGTPLTMWTDTLAGNLWFRDGSNRPIPIVINGGVAAGSGSIGGEYSSASALVSYSVSNLRYTFLTVVNGAYADLESAAVRIHLQGGGANAVIIKAPPGDLIADMPITFPAALPPSSVILTVDRTGSLRFDPTITVDGRGTVISGTVTLSGSQRLLGGALNLQGFGTVVLTGSSIATQTGSFAVVHASRDILHDNMMCMKVNPGPYVVTNQSGWHYSSSGLVGIPCITYFGTTTSADCPVYNIPLKTGDKLHYVELYAARPGVGPSGHVAMILAYGDAFIGETGLGTANTLDQNATSSGTIVANRVVAQNEMYYVRANSAGVTPNSLEAYHLNVYYSRPTGSV